MQIREAALSFAIVTFLLFIALLYLYFKNRKEDNFFYASLFFLCVTVAIFSQFLLEFNLTHNRIIFWSKFLYCGIFASMFTFPLFVSSLVGKTLSIEVKITLGIVSIVVICLTIFTNSIISNKTIYYFDVFKADKGNLYPYFMILFFIIVIYYYVQIIIASIRKLTKPINYTPVIIGLGIGMILATIDIIGAILRRPIIPSIRSPFIFGVFVTSVSFAWTLLSQYSLISNKLIKSRGEIERLIAKSKRDFVEFVHLIAKALDAKDKYTAGHSLRVMDYAIKIAKVLRLPENEIEMLKQACLLHDIGKVSIPDGILNKKSPLTKIEREHIYKHPVVGKQILSAVTEFQDILDIIYAHHERVDGKGYPNGKTREEIPLLARILAIADTYDAIRSERPYRKAKTKKQAIRELKKVKGLQLDKDIVETFIKTLTV
jgi:putative nucleotidyltransferase with HDIG domain